MLRNFFSRACPSVLLCWLSSAAGADLRPPAVPLVAHDPYFSIWSMADRLTDQPTKHWTGAVHSLSSLIRVDGATFRLMGNEPRKTPAMNQSRVEVKPTRTVYTFTGAGLSVELTFFTPALAENLDVLSRPATYVAWKVQSQDGKPHQVEVYFDAGSEISVNTRQDAVAWSRYRAGDLQILKAGSQLQPVLQKSGDDLRIDWGYLYVVAAPDARAASAATVRPTAMGAFSSGGTLPDSDEVETFQPYAQPEPVLAVAWPLGSVSSTPVARHLVLAYDDEYSIAYLERRLRPYWRRNGAGVLDMVRDALKQYDSLEAECLRFDETLMADLRAAGGDEYAQLCALSYRQTLAAHKLTADVDGTPLFFSKENFSNGSVDTVDVTYPSAPFFLLFNTRLLEAQLRPIMDYSNLPRWKFPFAPHDLGRYPLANGQQYGGGEKTEENQMPVEESGNMLLMVAAMEQANGNAQFADRYWPLLSKWAEYLKSKGLDPENQLCTDDFAGHLAHNANLSIKAILALAAYGKLAGMLGHPAIQAEYMKLGHEYATRWMQMDNNGDHYRLAFDRTDTWSQKYNLVWDKLLGLNLFPSQVISKELAFYASHQNRYGLPLDNRADYTKIDWLTWTATLAGNKQAFEAIFNPAYRFANETSSRVPLSDWYDTKTAKQIGFQARSVVGGLFIQMLADTELWKKYSSRSVSQ